MYQKWWAGYLTNCDHTKSTDGTRRVFYISEYRKDYVLKYSILSLTSHNLYLSNITDLNIGVGYIQFNSQFVFIIW